MKLIGIVGSNSQKSTNRELLQFMQKHFKEKAEIELVEIKDLPLFNKPAHLKVSEAVLEIAQKIEHAQGVIIATPEYDHAIPAALMNALAWLSYGIFPLLNKPVMITGASYGTLGSSRAQLQLRQILDAPGVNAYVLPGNEFLLGKAKEAFDDKGNIMEPKTVQFLELCLDNFVKYVEVVSKLRKPQPLEAEDLNVTTPIATTIEGIDPDDPDWVEKAAAQTHAVSGDTYVKLDHGILTVNQLNMFLNAMPFELTYADDNNQFLYYNNKHQDPETMLAKRVPAQSGNRLSTVHGTLPPQRMKNVEWVIATLRSGNQEYVRTAIPGGSETLINTHNYQAMYYPNGAYAGINEIVFNFKPWLDWYLETTGQKLVGPNAAMADATSGASSKGEAPKENAADATSGASSH